MPAEQARPALPRTPRTLLFCAGLLLAPALPAAEEQIFEPGSKHVCVPAASGEGWDCRSAEDGAAAPAAAKQESREPRLRSSRDVPDEAQTAAAGANEPAAAAPLAEPPPNTAAPAAAESSRQLPSYLLSPEAQSAPPPRATASEPPARAAAAAPAVAASNTAAKAAAEAAPPTAPAPAAVTAAVAPPTRTAVSDSPNASASETTAAVTAAPAAEAPARRANPQAPAAAAAPSPAAETPAATAAAATAPEPAPAHSAPLATLLGSSEFRRLGDGRFVLELASGADRRRVEDAAASLALGRGEIYLLPLQRDGAPWFVAVWGDFDSVDAARAARDEAAAAGATPGFPRRIGPLKQELR